MTGVLLGVEPVRVRFSECDAQQVAFNAHFLTWCDDALDVVLRRRCGCDPKRHGWEYALRAARLDFLGPVRPHDIVRLEVRLRAWHTTSFVVAFAGLVADTPVFDAEHTYVGLLLATRQPTPPPPAIRLALDLDGH